MNTVILRCIAPSHSPRAKAHAGPAEYRSAEAFAAAQAPASTPAPATPARSGTTTRLSHVVVPRAALVVICVAAAAIAWLVSSRSLQPAEPELAALLRGMAVLKGLLAAAAGGALWWRFGQPVAARVAVTYIACVGFLFASTVLIWQLAFIPAAAVLFHGAGLVALVLAMRQGRQMPRSGYQAPNPSIEATS